MNEQFVLLSSHWCFRPGTHYTIFAVLGATTCSPPNRVESLILLTTELKYLKDPNNEPGEASDGVTGAKLDIKPAGSL